jgi:hypothetical protein
MICKGGSAGRRLRDITANLPTMDCEMALHASKNVPFEHLFPKALIA